MKKINFSTTLFIFLFFLGCSKDPKSNDQLKSLTENSLIANAKNYFTENIITKISTINPLQNIPKTVLWDNAYTQKLSFGMAVIVPVECPSNWHVQANSIDNNLKLPLNNLMKLVIYKDAQLKYQTDLFTFIPDATFINGDKSKITGIVSINSWNGGTPRGIKYTSSGAYVINGAGANNTEVETNGPHPNVSSPETCVYIDYYSCAGPADDPYQTCSYDFTTFVGCTGGDGGGGSGGGGIGVADGSAVAGGNLPPSTPTVANYTATPASQICGSGYNWTDIGYSWTTQFAPMTFQIMYTGSGPLAGTINGYTIQAGCWQIPKARAPGKKDADKIVNAAWNYAVSQAPGHANAGNSVSNSTVIRFFVADVYYYFAQNSYGTSATFNPTGCTGSFTITPAPPPCDGF